MREIIYPVNIAQEPEGEPDIDTMQVIRDASGRDLEVEEIAAALNKAMFMTTDLRLLLERVKLHFQRGDPRDARYSKLKPEEIAEAFVADAKRASEEGEAIYRDVCTALGAA